MCKINVNEHAGAAAVASNTEACMRHFFLHIDNLLIIHMSF